MKKDKIKLCRLCESRTFENLYNKPAHFEQLCWMCYLPWVRKQIKTKGKAFPESIMTKAQKQIIYDEIMKDLGLGEEKEVTNG